MILNLGSLAFNANIATPGGNPAWGTELGQGEGYKFVFEDMSDFFTGMVYKSVADTENVTCPLGKGGNQRSDYDFVIASLFDKVYVNRKRVNNARFILLIVKKLNGDHHVGRRTIKYNPRMTYCGEYINEDCYRKMASTIGLSEDAAWFVYEIYIENQDELHFTAFELGQEPQTYRNNDERKNAFISKLPKGTKYSHRISQEPIDFLPTYRPYITAIKSKPFLLLAGISGTGKSRIVRELAFMTCPKELQDEDGTTPGNYCMIEVKPNWHDSSELLGYYSSFNGGGYRFTKFDRFVVKAWLNPDVPFFVCLDEMNLAPVEQYFAEFLSVLETRSRDKEGKVVTGALVDKQYFKDDTKMKEDLGLDGADDWTIKVRSDLVNKGLTLPPNLIVIGTVNMDDTTYQFSRKVIDRAMTIEMNGGELSQMFGNSNSLKYRSDEDVVKLGLFKAPYINADEVIERYQSQAQIIKEKLPEKLEAVNTALKDTPFQISYRVLNELVIYLGTLMDEATAKGETIDDDALPALIDQAMDQITLMKILPRIEGDEDMFRRSGGTNVLKTLQSFFSEETDSYKKLKEMIDRLDRTGFTRFWP